MDEIEVPTLFLCPISLQLMRDPVTICTGITYDRQNIEKWLCSCKNYNCPVTNQPLSHTDLTPNHTLHSFIQTWCTNNLTLGFKNVQTPKPTIDKVHVLKLISDAKNFPDKQLNCLKSLQSLAFETESNKYCLVSAGAIDFLASTIMKTSLENSTVINEVAIQVLFQLNPCGAHLKNLINNEGVQFIESLFHVLKVGNYKSRDYATKLLKSTFEVAGPTQLNSIRTELFVEIVKVLKDKASKETLKLVVELSSWGRNKVKAVKSGAVIVLIELLLNVSEKRECELMLVALDRLCECAEGRAELLNHGAGLAIVSKKILRISYVASDRGVRILSSICRYSGTPRVLQEMLVCGAVSKLCLLLQVEGSFKAKERAKETLKLHSSAWKNSICLPIPLLSSYP